MKGFTYLAIHDTACIVAAVVLVLHDHPWWAAAFTLLVASATVSKRKDS